MDTLLTKTLRDILHFAYPEEWQTDWLLLPIALPAGGAPYNFHVICSDVPAIWERISSWPPSSCHPNVWLRWEPSPGNGFWIRPRRYDPILYDRFLLVEPSAMVGPKSKQTISRQGLLDACHFAAKSGRMVWHNPPKGGASLPESAHFQSMPVYWNDHGVRRYTFPCCMHQPEAVPWTSGTELTVRFLERGIRRNQYPILGVTVSGPIHAAADYVWDAIWSYDKALACNLIMQPGNDSSGSARIRVFVFPRSRSVPRFSVTEDLLKEHEKMLMKNSRGGQWTDWSFAGVEMGLLTQVEWGVLFEEMRANPEQWGRTLMRLLAELTLKEGDADWIKFVNICR